MKTPESGEIHCQTHIESLVVGEQPEEITVTRSKCARKSARSLLRLRAEVLLTIHNTAAALGGGHIARAQISRILIVLPGIKESGLS